MSANKTPGGDCASEYREKHTSPEIPNGYNIKPQGVFIFTFNFLNVIC